MSSLQITKRTSAHKRRSTQSRHIDVEDNNKTDAERTSRRLLRKFDFHHSDTN